MIVLWVYQVLVTHRDRSDPFDNPYGYLVKHLEDKKYVELEDLFDSLPDQESTLKIALRMVYSGWCKLEQLSTHEKCTLYIEHVPVDKQRYDLYIRPAKRSWYLDSVDHLFYLKASGFDVDGVTINGEDWSGELNKYLKDFLALVQPVHHWKVRTLRICNSGLSTIPITLGWLTGLEYLEHNQILLLNTMVKKI